VTMPSFSDDSPGCRTWPSPRGSSNKAAAGATRRPRNQGTQRF
jgi:hypothetical protein